MPQQATATINRNTTSRAPYEKPRIQQMSEREILNAFQITQAMQTWWVTGC